MSLGGKAQILYHASLIGDLFRTVSQCIALIAVEHLFHNSGQKYNFAN